VTKTVSAVAVTDKGITEVVSVMDGATEEISGPLSGEEIIEESLVMDGTAKEIMSLVGESTRVTSETLNIRRKNIG